MLKHELILLAKYDFSFSKQHLDQLSLKLRYSLQMDNIILSIILNSAIVELGLFSDDLLMSLDDFAELRLKPALIKIADNSGYATWD